MQAAVIAGDRMVKLAHVPKPEPARGQVLIRVEGCGVCASSLPVWEGRPWFRYPLSAGEPGHEGWGVIDGTRERVAFLSTRAFAQYDVADAEQLAPIPDSLAGRNIPGEALACVMNILRRSAIEPRQTVVIIGAGFLGNALVQLCRGIGAQTIVVSRRAAARERAKACGADETIPMDDHHAIVSRIRERTGGRGAERVIECVGAQWPLDIAGDVIGEGGRVMIAGYHQDGARQVNLQRWNWLGIDVINAHERDINVIMRGMREGIDAVAEGKIDLDLLVTHTYSFDELGQAFANVAERPDGFVKGVLRV